MKSTNLKKFIVQKYTNNFHIHTYVPVVKIIEF